MGGRTRHEAEGVQMIPRSHNLTSFNRPRKLADVTNNSLIPILPSTNWRPPASVIAEEHVDAREIDKVLSELAGMIGRWRLFRKFILESLRVRPSVFL